MMDANALAQCGFDQTLLEDMIAARRHLHAHPELSNQEFETQAFIRDWLAARSLTDARVASSTGIVVDIIGEAGHSNRKIAVRADIDALPITESTGLPFASVNPGVMHACGHDSHTAMALAASVALYRMRHQFRGTIRMIFQPAEEAEPLGGRRIVQQERLLDDIDAAIGIHVDPYLETGCVAAAPGPYSLASDIFDIVIHGRSAHAAKPNEGVDAITVAASVVGEVQKLVSRESDAFDPLIISITGIQGGGSYNILADQVFLKGTIRSGKETTRHRAQQRIEEIVHGIATTHGATAELKFIRGEPPVVNDPLMVQTLTGAAEGLIGSDAIRPLPGWTAADDFGFYSEAKPAVYFRLGVRNEKLGSVFPLHHPSFKIDEAAMAIGASLLAQTARDFLSAQE